MFYKKRHLKFQKIVSIILCNRYVIFRDIPKKRWVNHILRDIQLTDQLKRNFVIDIFFKPNKIIVWYGTRSKMYGCKTNEFILSNLWWNAYNRYLEQYWQDVSAVKWIIHSWSSWMCLSYLIFNTHLQFVFIKDERIAISRIFYMDYFFINPSVIEIWHKSTFMFHTHCFLWIPLYFFHIWSYRIWNLT